MKSSMLVLIAVTLSGCAASGKLYNDMSADAVAMGPNQGRLTVFRTKETLVAAGRDVLVTLDHASGKSVGYGGFASIDTSAGQHGLSIALAGEKSRCEIGFSLEPSRELFFELKPNTGRVVGEAVIAGVSTGWAASGIYQTMSGQAADPNNCSGYFSIAPVDREYAQKQLATIRASAQ
jgi:hypothetical protein